MSDRNDIFNAPLIQDGKILAPLSSGRANVSIGEIARHVAQHATGLMADDARAELAELRATVDTLTRENGYAARSPRRSRFSATAPGTNGSTSRASSLARTFPA